MIFENPRVKSSFSTMMEKMDVKVINIFLWLSFHHNFPSQSCPEVQPLLEKQLTVYYAKFYFMLTDLEKERKLQIVPFVLGEVILQIFFKHF